MSTFQRFFSLVLAASCLGLPAAFAQERADDAAPEAIQVRSRPAHIDGLWCGVGLLHEFSISVSQRHQLFDAQLQRKGRTREVTGRIDGTVVRTDTQRNVTLVLQAIGNELRILDGTGQLALARGQSFTRAAGASCGA